MENVAALFDRAMRCHQRGDLQQAETLYRQILADDPAHADTLHLLGFLEHQIGRSASAVALIRQAIGLNPTAAVCHANLGIVLMEQGLLAEAVASYREALRLQPRFADALGNLALALKDLGQPEEAAQCCRQALAVNPRHAHALNVLGNILKDQRQLAEAIDCYERALKIDPQFCDALSNLGLALKDEGRVAEAIARYHQALSINPNHAIAHNNLAIASTSQGDFAAGAAGFEHALSLKPDYASARWNHALLKLLQGDFLGAWPAFECRWQLAGFVQSHVERPLWDGAPLQGKTILLYAEQGLGDTIQFLRYAPLVRQRCGAVLVECQPSLERLLTGIAEVDGVYPAGAALPPFDVRAPLMSLPGLFATSVATIPADIPYLRANPRLVDQWRQELATLEGLKIGIAWQGSPTHEDDRNRSVPLTAFAPLARLPGVRLVSLQVGPGAEQLTTPPGAPFVRGEANPLVRAGVNPFAVTDLGSRFNTDSLEDLAAALVNLDLVVTVDTAVAHLAGALGVPVWVALPFVPDWRWLLERTDSPWYPTMRLFRQGRPGDWDEVFARIATAARDLAPPSRGLRYAEARGSATKGTMPTIAHLFDLAVGHHQHGDLKEAEALYRQILQADSFHADAHHLLGLLAHQTGHHEAAIPLIRQAIALNPTAAAFHSNLGTVLQAAGRAHEALPCFAQAVQLDPHFPDALNNLGNALMDQGQVAEAVQHFQQALRSAPDHGPAHYNLANALREQGQVTEAEAGYRRALQINPRHAQAHNNLGLALRDLGKPADAVECYRQALAVDPCFAVAHLNLGNALKARVLTTEAIACYREAVRIRPGYVEALSNLGLALKDQEGHGAEAVECCRQALRLDPNHVPTHVNLGTVLQEQGRLDEAAACYDQAIRLKPAATTPRYHRSLLWLLSGAFDKGWPEYECRWQEPGALPRNFPQPLWNGDPLDGKTILLHAEQGLGDTIQFSRYAALVKERGGTVLLECQPVLVDVLEGLAGVDSLLAQGKPLVSFDCHAPLLSLPGILRTTRATIPANIPYLRTRPELIDNWAKELAPLNSFKVGIAWQGNPQHDRDRQRSVPLNAFEPLAQQPGISLVSLQKGPGTEQMHSFAKRCALLDLSARLDSFLDTAAVMMNLDLIVTVDSAVAHLAGALGLPVWVMLPYVPDWRWLLERQDSPWYPTMRLFRRQRRGDWNEVFGRLADALKSHSRL